MSSDLPSGEHCGSSGTLGSGSWTTSTAPPSREIMQICERFRRQSTEINDLLSVRRPARQIPSRENSISPPEMPPKNDELRLTGDNRGRMSGLMFPPVHFRVCSLLGPSYFAFGVFAMSDRFKL
jgi:hypothetical protein